MPRAKIYCVCDPDHQLPTPPSTRPGISRLALTTWSTPPPQSTSEKNGLVLILPRADVGNYSQNYAKVQYSMCIYEDIDTETGLLGSLTCALPRNVIFIWDSHGWLMIYYK